MTRPRPTGMLTMLDDGLWEADARLELEELAERVDARLTAEDDEIDTLGGLVFLLAGRIPPGRIASSTRRAGGWKPSIPTRAGSSASGSMRRR